MILPATIPIDLPSGGRLEIDVDLDCIWYAAEGDGWHEPRIPEHYELDGHTVIAARWYHPDNSHTTLQALPGSIIREWLERFLDKRFGLLVEAMDEFLTERA